MRLTVTRKSDLALRAMRTLATSRASLQGEDLAATIGTSRGFLVQVMTPLVRAKWVVSSPGPLGGYRLRPGVTASVLAVIEAVEGPTDMANCVLDADAACTSTGPGERNPCALHDPWIRARRAMREELAQSPAVSAKPGAEPPDTEGDTP